MILAANYIMLSSSYEIQLKIDLVDIYGNYFYYYLIFQKRQEFIFLYLDDYS